MVNKFCGKKDLLLLSNEISLPSIMARQHIYMHRPQIFINDPARKKPSQAGNSIHPQQPSYDSRKPMLFSMVKRSYQPSCLLSMNTSIHTLLLPGKRQVSVSRSIYTFYIVWVQAYNQAVAFSISPHCTHLNYNMTGLTVWSPRTKTEISGGDLFWPPYVEHHLFLH